LLGRQHVSDTVRQHLTAADLLWYVVCRSVDMSALSVRVLFLFFAELLRYVSVIEYILHTMLQSQQVAGEISQWQGVISFAQKVTTGLVESNGSLPQGL